MNKLSLGKNKQKKERTLSKRIIRGVQGFIVFGAGMSLMATMFSEVYLQCCWTGVWAVVGFIFGFVKKYE